MQIGYFLLGLLIMFVVVGDVAFDAMVDKDVKIFSLDCEISLYIRLIQIGAINRPMLNLDR